MKISLLYAICKAVVQPALLVLLLSVVSLSQAQTFYVATNGNDQPSGGSLQNPWATISYAIDRVSDGATIEVLPGTYNGRVRLDQKFNNGITIRSSEPYKARLRYNAGAVVICFTCRGVTFEGFDIAHASTNTTALVIQIQNSEVSNVTLRNNIIHDSTNNDLLKVNNGARDVLIEGNLFYNQAGTDEHIDINSTIGITVQDNVFFNTGSQSATSSFVLIKDSNGNSDGVLGTKDTTVRRNIFLNWQGNNSQGFLRVGEDGTSNFEADGVLVENNLMIGNSSRLMRSSFTVQGSRDVKFRNNTVVGDLPSRSYAARLLRGSQNQPNQQIVLSNNIWSDPNGSIGAEGFIGADVFEALPGANQSVTLNRNLYYNGGASIPADTPQEVRVSQDASALIGNPLLPNQNNVVLPVWNGTAFGGGAATIRDVFMDLAERYGKPAANSIVIDRADASDVPVDDIRGAVRGSNPDVGAFERSPSGPPPPPPRPPRPGGERPAMSWLLLLLE